MKRTIKILLTILSVTLIVVLFFLNFSNYLDKEIDRLYLKNKVYIDHEHGFPIKDKGNILIRKGLEDQNMLIMGSSELHSPVPENIKNLFPNSLYKTDVSLVGHANVQNALHAINLGANSESLNGTDIVIIESLQWFLGDDIGTNGFLSNFSELQFYQFLHNDRISNENKNYLCKRYIQLENASTISRTTTIDDFLPYNVIYDNITYKQTYILAKLYTTDNIFGKFFYQLLRPYYWLRYNILTFQDKYHTYNWLKGLNFTFKSEEKNLDWNQINITAKERGKQACTNNDLFVDDTYYTEYIADKYDELKDYKKNSELLKSNEWNDFKFLLSVCDDLNIKPYITIMSTNGLYYDYIGITKKQRDEYYDKIEKVSLDLGYDVLNLKDFEYTPYFYYDVMHLGWKGWPYVTENIIKYFSK